MCLEMSALKVLIAIRRYGTNTHMLCNMLKQKIIKMSGCKILKKWDEQNKFKFGFIPLGDLKMPDEYSPSPLGVTKDLITLHKKLRASDQMNFMSVQTHVPSQLNPEVWECLLKNYWDVQLPLLIRHGFPLDFNRDSILESHTENHTSATEFPHDVQAYLDEETNDVESKTSESFTTLKNLLQALGFQLSEKKIITPTRKMNCLGIVVDTETFTTSIPPQKLQEIFNLCAAWQNKKTCSKRELQSLLSSLLYVSKCVKNSSFS